MSSNWFKNLVCLKVGKCAVSADELESILSKHALQPCASNEMESVGWLAPKGSGHPFVHRSQGHLLLALGTEKKILPGAVVAQFADLRAAEIEEQSGVKVGRKQFKEIKEQVTQELLPRAFSVQNKVFAWLDPVGGWLVVNASGMAKADEFVEALRKVVDVESLTLTLVKTSLSPGQAMTGWLSGGEAPAGFTVDRDCELRGTGDEKPTVRYAHHCLDETEIPKHIEAGKQATKLALTWKDKISFVLTESMELKRLTALDVMKEQAAEAEDQFDGDFAMMSGELSLLLPDLMAALGGLEQPAG